MGGARLSGVHSCRQFLDRALAPEVMFPSPQRLKPSDSRILTAPLKRCSTLYTKCENALATIFGRTVSAVTFPRPAPGFWSSPPMAAAAIYLLVQLRRTKAMVE